ncbi:DNA-directed RNA polymerase subunit delta [Companilactobacillus kimchii]|uniref:Probable DNA-directed RNA polymerase subunit delta n=2 Tax=Companilactobacillus kimchii TaxID=2801452 RepID=A0ABR5NU04_9LACO|nr:DNA-directed RNA polymerase subunit delta [Companilactobacillus kimchii]GEO47783.1 putative DNA-directed RNA polymerase subunit delta [Companilactobacillus paralimentarius]KAE9558729.1 DNA-directed RNA polymerase subunit delta [Companilactobacillus kimchii]KAE9560958.1 DNA-directed RNA polymerase subunit delta [Companilactobacillus kimchii]KRK51861.1 DNA-directed RNA polymerase subunit delta [Companilactobacillus kimchii DSM 13961 = JCM 10707]OWF33847.1 putative DNA-directed RNA polymerase 
MKFDKFKDQNKDELSLIEVAYEILNENNKKVMNFSDIVNEIQDYLGKSDEDIKRSLPQFYTDLNNDGSFLSLGENVWGLRKWYPYDSVDEEVNHPEDNGTENAHKAAQKVNAFLSDDDEDDDVVDYEDDSDLDVNEMDDDDDSDGSDNGPDLSKFTNSDLTSVDDDDDDPHDEGLDDGIEGQLSEFDADDDDDEDIDLNDDDDDEDDDDDDDKEN